MFNVANCLVLENGVHKMKNNMFYILFDGLIETYRNNKNNCGKAYVFHSEYKRLKSEFGVLGVKVINAANNKLKSRIYQ